MTRPGCLPGRSVYPARPGHPQHDAPVRRRRTVPRRKERRVAENTETFLTQDAYDRLAAELEHLSTTGRTEIAARIEAARE